MAAARRPRKQIVTERMVDEWVALYADGAGEGLTAIAKAYKITAQAVRYHLNKRGALRSGQETEMETAAEESDEVLGIGEDDEAPVQAFSVEALMDHPDFSRVLEAAVAQKLAAMGHQAPAPSATGNSAFDAFLAKFDHMVEVQAEQRPGYIKPLSADEVDSRRKGKADMFELLREYKATNVWPTYLIVGEGPGATFYGPSPNGDILYEAGQQIKTRLPPSELFQPMDEAAARVWEAYKRWVGEVYPVEELIAQAAATARGDSGAPEMDQKTKILDPEVMLVDGPKRDVGPKRTFGTTVPELRGTSMPQQPGVAAQPVGPVFVEAG